MRGHILNESTYMKYSKQKQKADWQLPGSGGDEGMGNKYIMDMGFNWGGDENF